MLIVRFHLIVNFLFQPQKNNSSLFSSEFEFRTNSVHRHTGIWAWGNFRHTTLLSQESWLEANWSNLWSIQVHYVTQSVRSVWCSPWCTSEHCDPDWGSGFRRDSEGIQEGFRRNSEGIQKKDFLTSEQISCQLVGKHCGDSGEVMTSRQRCIHL